MPVKLPYLASLAVSIIFGFSFIFTKEALQVLTPFQLLGFRFAGAALLLTMLKFGGLIKIDFAGKPVKKLFILAAFQPFLYFICENFGVKLTSASQAGMMIAVVPVVSAVLGAAFLKEYPTKAQWFFIFLSVSGVFLIIFYQGSLGGENKLIGTLILLGAAFAAGVYNILSRKNSLEFKPLEITYIMMWVGAVVFNVLGIIQAFATNVSFNSYITVLLDVRAYSAILYLGILSSVLAFLLLNFSLAHIQASQAAVFTNLTTLISILAGVLILKEDFFWYQGLGAILIILGVWGTLHFSSKHKTQSITVDYVNKVVIKKT